jgi:hypothetical protein
MTYPDGIDALVNVNANDTLAAGGHAARHNSVNTALGEVKDFLGTGVGYRYNSTVYFTSNGTFTKATYPWLRAIRVIVQGGGGGGAGIATAGARGGGWGGDYAERFITDISGLDASVTVTIGAGGSGGAAGAAGGNGGDSDFNASGSLRTRSRGGNGASADGTRVTDTTVYADADVTFRGGAPGIGGQSTEILPGGLGGSSHLGGGGAPGDVGGNRNGLAGQPYGGGGSGASRATTGNATGGAGADGIVIVELYA